MQWRLAWLGDLLRHETFRSYDGYHGVVLFQLSGSVVVSIEGQERTLSPYLVVEVAK